MASGTESASPPAVTQLGELEKSSPQFRRQLKSVLYVNKTDWANFVASLNEDDALSFIDILDEVSPDSKSFFMLNVTHAYSGVGRYPSE